jgi:hypothetical protein
MLNKRGKEWALVLEVKRAVVTIEDDIRYGFLIHDLYY